MWLMTTRNRPDACKALIDAMTALRDVPEFAVMIDHTEADALAYAGVPWPAHWHVHISDDHLEMAAAVTRLIEMYPGQPFYGLACDHARPATKGWAAELEISAGDWNVAWPNDGWVKGRRPDRPWMPRICGAVVLGGKLVQTLGWAMLPGLVHLYIDDAMEALGDRLGLLRYRPDVLVRPDRPETTGKPYDDNAKRIHKGVAYTANDLETLKAWRDGEGMIRDVERVSQASGIQPIDTLITFACVKVGDRYDAKWVNILLDMVRRHVPGEVKFRFVCITDDPEGLADGIEVVFAEQGLRDWWAKMQLFKPDTFAAGSRIVYLDLDSLVLDSLDEILSYRGPLAMLRDFYFDDELGSGVMMWGVDGSTRDLWTDWVLSGEPRLEGGDQAWLLRMRPNAIRLQDVYPGKFVSYKAHCRVAIPDGATVVSFHGFPKNDEAPEAWVKEVWKIGGVGLTKARVALNTEDSVILDNMRSASKRSLRWVRKCVSHGRAAVLVGGGASVADHLDEIRSMAANGADIFALNGAAQYLQKNGVAPKYLVLVDPREANARFIDNDPAAHYLIASQCAPEIIERAIRHTHDPDDFGSGDDITLFHLDVPGAEAHKPPLADACWCSTTVGLTALGLVYMLGYRMMHLYGYDSSYREGRLHAYEQMLTEQEGRQIEVWCEGRSFITSPVMLKQTEEFQTASSMLADAGAVIAVHGDGLLPHVARTMANRRNAAPEEKAA